MPTNASVLGQGQRLSKNAVQGVGASLFSGAFEVETNPSICDVDGIAGNDNGSTASAAVAGSKSGNAVSAAVDVHVINRLQC